MPACLTVATAVEEASPGRVQSEASLRCSALPRQPRHLLTCTVLRMGAGDFEWPDVKYRRMARVSNTEVKVRLSYLARRAAFTKHAVLCCAVLCCALFCTLL